MIRFETASWLPFLEGELHYIDTERSFDFKRASAGSTVESSGARETASLSLGTLQLEVSVGTGQLLHPWGYHSRALWVVEDLPAVPRRIASVQAVSNFLFEPGVTYDVTGSLPWVTYCDARTGWLLVTPAREQAVQVVDAIEFSRGAALSLSPDGTLAGLWMKPTFVSS